MASSIRPTRTAIAPARPSAGAKVGRVTEHAFAELQRLGQPARLGELERLRQRVRHRSVLLTEEPEGGGGRRNDHHDTRDV